MFKGSVDLGFGDSVGIRRKRCRGFKAFRISVRTVNPEGLVEVRVRSERHGRLPQDVRPPRFSNPTRIQGRVGEWPYLSCLPQTDQWTGVTRSRRSRLSLLDYSFHTTRNLLYHKYLSSRVTGRKSSTIHLPIKKKKKFFKTEGRRLSDRKKGVFLKKRERVLRDVLCLVT